MRGVFSDFMRLGKKRKQIGNYVRLLIRFIILFKNKISYLTTLKKSLIFY